jgi:segregation and condensation protein B
MSSVAKMIETIETGMDAEVSDKEVGPQANPEHLRMVEALLFAASEPLDQKALSTSLPEGAAVSPENTNSARRAIWPSCCARSSRNRSA